MSNMCLGCAEYVTEGYYCSPKCEQLILKPENPTYHVDDLKKGLKSLSAIQAKVDNPTYKKGSSMYSAMLNSRKQIEERCQIIKTYLKLAKQKKVPPFVSKAVADGWGQVIGIRCSSKNNLTQ